MAEVTNEPTQVPVFVPEVSKVLDEKLNNIKTEGRLLESMISDILSIQLLLRKEGQFLTKHAFREAQKQWRDAVEILAESYSSTWGRNTSWVSAAVSGVGVAFGAKEIGDVAAKGVGAQGEHWAATEHGARSILQYIVEKVKSQTDSTKYTSQNEQQQVDEMRQTIARVHQALHDLWSVLTRG